MQSEWKRKVALAGIFLTFAVVTTVPGWSQDAPAADGSQKPSIYAPTPEYNFGEMDNEEVVKHAFTIVNVGTAPLELGKPKTSCGCTVAALQKTVLAPGEETTIAAELKLAGKQGDLTKSISVPSNDPEKPLYELKLVGVAVAAITMEPQYANFGTIADEDVHERTVIITATKPGLTFNVQEVKSSSDEFEAELKTLEEGTKYEVTVKTKPSLEPGNYAGAVTLQTDYANRPVLQVRMNAQVVGALDVLPNSINISYAPGETSSQWLQVRPGRVSEFEITGIEVPVEGMSADFRLLNNNIYQVQVKDMPRDETLEGKELVIKTNLADPAELRVPFQVLKPRADGGFAPAGVAATPAPAAAE